MPTMRARHDQHQLAGQQVVEMQALQWVDAVYNAQIGATLQRGQRNLGTAPLVQNDADQWMRAREAFKPLWQKFDPV